MIYRAHSPKCCCLQGVWPAFPLSYPLGWLTLLPSGHSSTVLFRQGARLLSGVLLPVRGCRDSSPAPWGQLSVLQRIRGEGEGYSIPMPPRGRRLKRPALPHSGCQDSSPAPTLPGPATLCRQTRCRACIFLLFLSLYLCNFPQPFTLSSPPPYILLLQYTLSCPLSNPWSHFHCYMPTCICTYYIFLNTICSVCVMFLHACLEGWLFGMGQPIGMLFLIDYLSHSQCIWVPCSSLCMTKTLWWTFPVHSGMSDVVLVQLMLVRRYGWFSVETLP